MAHGVRTNVTLMTTPDELGQRVDDVIALATVQADGDEPSVEDLARFCLLVEDRMQAQIDQLEAERRTRTSDTVRQLAREVTDLRDEVALLRDANRQIAGMRDRIEEQAVSRSEALVAMSEAVDAAVRYLAAYEPVLVPRQQAELNELAQKVAYAQLVALRLKELT